MRFFFILTAILGCQSTPEMKEQSEKKDVQSETTKDEPNQSKMISLDALFQGIENACGESATLHSLLKSMRKSDYSSKKALSLNAPKELQEVFGTPTIVNDDEEHMVSQTMISKASYLGLPVITLSHHAGYNNGINGFSIILDADFKVAQDIISKNLKIKDSCQIDPDSCDFGNYKMEVLETKDNKTLIYCDKSN